MDFGKDGLARKLLREVSALAAIALCCAHAAPAFAADPAVTRADAAGGMDDIIVTARRRDESIMRTPVVVQAVTAQQIQNLRITDTPQLAAVTPGLNIAVGFATVGASVYLRGLGNGLAANFIDQSVLLNVDGASLSHGAFYRTGLFDVGQIEILKGPQALFYGKSSTAGIIAIHSADPTPQWESKVTTGYEFNADEYDLQAYVSGPLTEHLGIRVAGYFNDMKGYFYNRNPANTSHRVPNQTEYGGRLTLRYEAPEAGLDAKLKLSRSHTSSNMWQGDLAQFRCSGTTPQVQGYAPFEDCKPSRFTAGNPNPNPYNPSADFSAGSADYATSNPSPLFRDGRPYDRIDTGAAIFSLDVDVVDQVKFSSLTSYSDVKVIDSGRSLLSNPSCCIDLAARFRQRDFSQELRLTSDFDNSFINFMFGALYAKGKGNNHLVGVLPAFTYFTDNNLDFTNKTTSAFGQILLTPVDKWELSVGARYTNVHKYFTSLRALNNLFPGSGEQIDRVPGANRSIREHDFSPEVTLTYRPTDRLTAFLSYKQGYKGPGFNATTTAFAFDATQVSPFGGEHVEGFEGGIKSQLADRQIALTLSLYSYKYKGIQVAFPDIINNVVLIRNGADARIKGIELGVDYRPQAIEGLLISAFANYNHADFTSFPNAPCYGGQTPAQGCMTATSGAQFQDLAGRQLGQAPRWTGRVAVDYQTSVSANYIAGINLNTNYSSSYNSVAEQNPFGIQKKYVTIDAALRVGPSSEAWQIGLVGRNLTNRYIIAGAQDGGTQTPGVTGDANIYVRRPRQVMVQLTVRPDRF